MMKTTNKTRQVSVVMIITVVSKCLGFLRDVVLAKYFGAGSVTDAYFVAQTIPESLFSLVVQAISIGFIPIYTQVLHDKGKEESNNFVNNILKLSLSLCVALVLIVNFFPNQVVSIFASGFDEETFAFTVRFVRISVFAMFFRITVAVYSAYLNANNQFTAPAFNGVILDVVSIISIIAAFYTHSVVLVFGIVASSFVQFVALLPSVYKRKPLMSLSVKNIFNDEVKQMVRMFIPVALGVGVNQLNVIADRTMASSIPGAISSLNYANKVDNVLENIIILSLATVMFPTFAKYIASKNMDSFKSSVVTSLNVVTFTMLPCSVFAIIFSNDIIHILFGRGAFDASAVESSAIAMTFYSVGLLFLSYNAIFTRAFYALKKVKLVSIVSVGTFVTNVTMNFLLKPLMGIGGLALATSISNIVTMILLTVLLRKVLGKGFIPDILKEFIKVGLASAVLAVSAYFINATLGGIHYIIAIAVSVLVSSAGYLLVCYLLKSQMMMIFVEKLIKKLIKK